MYIGKPHEHQGFELVTEPNFNTVQYHDLSCETTLNANKENTEIIITFLMA